MSNLDPSRPLPGSSSKQFDRIQISAALANAGRRELLVAIAMRGPKTAIQLVNEGLAPKLDVTLKNLKVWMDAGLVVQHENPDDGRRYIYSLAPDVNTTTAQNRIIFDFGFCVVRLPQIKKN